MKISFLLAVFLTLTPALVYSQDVCPPDKVCITREAAIKALADADKVIALEAEGKAKDEAIGGLRKELNDMRIEFAATRGELSGIKQNAVQDRAIIDLLLKSAKKKCMPFSICF